MINDCGICVLIRLAYYTSLIRQIAGVFPTLRSVVELRTDKNHGDVCLLRFLFAFASEVLVILFLCSNEITDASKAEFHCIIQIG